MLTPGVDVVPLDDLRTHEVPGGYEEDRDGAGWLTIERPNVGAYTYCWCQPRIEPQINPNGSMGVIYVHRAMDRREN